MPNDFIVEIKQGTSKNTGNTYVGLIITFPNGYEKYVPLEKAEQFIVLGLTNNN